MNTLTIRNRLYLGFMTLSIPLLIVIVIFLLKISDIAQLSEKMGKVYSLPANLDAEIFETRDYLYLWAISGDPTAKLNFEKTWQQVYALTKKADDVINIVNNNQVSSEWKHFKELTETLHNEQSKVINSKHITAILPSLQQRLIKIRPIAGEIIDLLDGARASTGERKGGLYDQVNYELRRSIYTIINETNVLKDLGFGLLAFAIIISFAIPFLTARSISRPLDKSIDVAQRIAGGERDIAIKVTSMDETGKLLSSLKTMQNAIKKNEEKIKSSEEETKQLFQKMLESSRKFSLHSSKVASGDLRERLEINKDDIMQELGKDLNLMTDSLATITKKITQISTDMVNMIDKVTISANEQSENITSQASAINEISVSLEEIDKSSKQTMAKAQALREAAKNTYEQGKLGSQSIEQSILGIKDSEKKMGIIAQTILDLSNHTQQIGEITSVVNTLALQSKMLALNASIEASKAGEAGRGFAVVATEVKNLAEQSEQSTAQVQRILEDIRLTTEKAVKVTEEGTKTLDVGTQLIEKAGEVIQTLSKMINEASISSQHIEASIRQESVGIDQIVSSMKEINRATTSFAEGVKETTAFINELSDIAQHLKDDVNIYKI